MNSSPLRRFAILPLLLGITLAPAAAGPDDPGDLRLECAARRAALAESVDVGTFVLFGPDSPGVRGTAPEPNFRYLTGLTEAGSALVVTVRRPHSTERASRVYEVAAEIEAASALLRTLLRQPGSAEWWAELSTLDQTAVRSARQARLAMREERGPAAVEARLYLRPRSKPRERLNGPALYPGPGAARTTGIETVRPLHRLVPDLLELLQRTPLYLLDANAPPPKTLVPLMEQRPELAVHSARPIIARLRAVKSPAEISLIRRACELTAAGLRRSMRTCRPGMAEYELQAALEFDCRRGGARRQAFDSIVASGPNSTILHYRRNTRRIRNGELVLMDVGAEVEGYAADVTRTFPANGVFTGEQARIYDVVLAAQEAAIAVIRPGATLSEVNAAARAVITKAGLKRGWRHGVSHHVGLDVHDPPASGPLLSGMVFTVEPGVYLPESGIGIRIEDTVVVTGDGCTVLSAKITRDRAEIEKIMSAGRLTEERER